MNNFEFNEQDDLSKILEHELVKEASFENEMGFGTGILKDGRFFEFGRANRNLEISIFQSKEDFENNLNPIETILLD